MVALFWSFTNSIMNLEQAKGAYGLIITIAQFGAIAGSTLATQAVHIGIPQLCLIGSVFILVISLVVKIYWILFHHVPEVKVQNILIIFHIIYFYYYCLLFIFIF